MARWAKAARRYRDENRDALCDELAIYVPLPAPTTASEEA